MDISLAPSGHTSAAYYVYGHEATGNLGVYNVTTGRFYAPIAYIPGGVQLDGRRKHVAEFKNEAGMPLISKGLKWFWANGWRKVANACNHDSVTCEDAGHQPATPRKVSGTHADGWRKVAEFKMALNKVSGTHAGGCQCTGTHPPGMAGDILTALWRGLK